MLLIIRSVFLLPHSTQNQLLNIQPKTLAQNCLVLEDFNQRQDLVKYYVRKSRRKTRTLGTGQPAHGLDLFDIGIMAGIKESLSRIKKKSKIQRKKKILNEINFDSCGNSVILNGHVTSRKQDENGTVHYLVSWLPQGL